MVWLIERFSLVEVMIAAGGYIPRLMGGTRGYRNSPSDELKILESGEVAQGSAPATDVPPWVRFSSKFVLEPSRTYADNANEFATRRTPTCA
jgi:hypothetical protein